MSNEKLLLLRDELSNSERAAEHLRVSLKRCAGLLQCKSPSLEELERLESLASRFARLADLLIQRLLRLIDDLELEESGSVLDGIGRAEKRGLVDEAGLLITIRELRNVIAHEYAADKMHEIYRAVTQIAPALIDICVRTNSYSRALLGKYAST
ncbi:MAG: HepT-like ribonuclease domain-containing protein [Burkholderiales bacterium]